MACYDYTISGCYDKDTGKALFNFTSFGECLHAVCYIDSGVHMGQIALTVDRGSCSDTYYGCIAEDGSFIVTVPPPDTVSISINGSGFCNGDVNAGDCQVAYYGGSSSADGSYTLDYGTGGMYGSLTLCPVTYTKTISWGVSYYRYCTIGGGSWGTITYTPVESYIQYNFAQKLIIATKYHIVTDTQVGITCDRYAVMVVSTWTGPTHYTSGRCGDEDFDEMTGASPTQYCRPLPQCPPSDPMLLFDNAGTAQVTGVGCE